MFLRRMRLPAAMTMLLIITLTSVGVSAQTSLDPAMTELWERSDLPVSDHTVSRSWLWGPQVIDVLYEPYASETLEDGQRLVAYFDKSRMEINDPDGDPSSIWHVTNGLLVVELITGRIQIGDNEFEPAIPPDIEVAGPITYEVVGDNLDQEPYAEGELIDSAYSWVGVGPGFRGERLWFIVEDSTDETIVSRNILAAHYVAETNHTIAAPFWEFMNSSGLVYENGQYIEGPLFHNPFLATGYPITEANWTEASERGILFQCFERRCLTYAPNNPEGWQVEAGNIGQHYYQWRHIDNGIPCSSEPEHGIGELWRSNSELRAAVGCPGYIFTDGVNYPNPFIKTSFQRFEHGSMLWTKIEYGGDSGSSTYLDYADVYVLYDDGDYWIYDDEWDDTQPVDDPTISPPDGLYQPVAGFGKVWRDNPEVRDRLGWATEPESASIGEIQPFEHGTMIWREAEDLIWAFYDGGWEVYEDTFDE